MFGHSSPVNHTPDRLMGDNTTTITLDDMPYLTFTQHQLLAIFLSRLRSKRTGQVFLESRGAGLPCI